MFDALFEFLFKYRPVMFERGDIAFATSRPLAVAALLMALAAAAALITYARVGGKSGPRDRLILGGVRVALVALLLFCLLRPTLLVPTSVPQRNFLAVLLDDSRSMQIGDIGEARGDFVRRAFDPRESQVMAELGERFILRFFRFSSSTDRIAGPDELSFGGARTDLGRALDRARQELASAPVAGIVLASDGADNAHQTLTEPLLALRSRSIPVFTVGVGRESFTKDIAIKRIETPRTVLKGTSLVVDLLVVQRGYRGQTVQLQVEDAGRIVATEEVTLGADGEAKPVRVTVTATETGPRSFRFRIAPRPDEMVTQNNEQEALVLVGDGREKILYLEGEPRFEAKFIRRAVAEDDNLQVVLLQRTAEAKFLRLGVDDREELVTGFPTTREELFAYRAIIIGSIEASFVTHDQLRMLAEFVGQRGGGLLMLGGRRAFSEGGYAGTPLADVLPVVLDEPSTTPATGSNGNGNGGARRDEDGDIRVAELKVEVTPAGLASPATRIAPTERASVARWRDLPPLTAVNQVTRTKPGATTLLSARHPDGGRQVVLAHQRYGRGKAMALTVQDSWLWQMHADIPVEDLTHETFWRQLLRWLVSGVPGRVTIATAADRVAPGEMVGLRAEIDDPGFVKVNGADVIASVKAPSGAVRELPMEWAVDRDGEYRASFAAEEAGLYEVRVGARAGGADLGGDVTFVQAADLKREFVDAEMQSAVLRRIADETRGRFYTPETMGTLSEDISVSGGGTTVIEPKDLWDMPILFLLLLGLAATEWGLRRRRGLA
ncbi:MAG TPA: hypothetical protein VMM18_00855 [Gemmatimonadaceae bacterium]|nr:hypothetical protein [Gemmatimonadaceae bacterium]